MQPQGQWGHGDHDDTSWKKILREDVRKVSRAVRAASLDSPYELLTMAMNIVCGSRDSSPSTQRMQTRNGCGGQRSFRHSSRHLPWNQLFPEKPLCGGVPTFIHFFAARLHVEDKNKIREFSRVLIRVLVARPKQARNCTSKKQTKFYRIRALRHEKA